VLVGERRLPWGGLTAVAFYYFIATAPARQAIKSSVAVPPLLAPADGADKSRCAVHHRSPNKANPGAITSENGEKAATASDKDDAIHILDHAKERSNERYRE
jgi:hypothetical protein